MIEFLIGGFLGILFGFFICAILNAGKMADLEKESDILRNKLNTLEEVCYPIVPPPSWKEF